MNKSFYIGALGAHQQQKSMAVTGNNIANVNTYGFKGEKSRFQNLLYQDIKSADGGDVKTAAGTHMVAADTIYRAGGAAITNRMQDYMIEGDGFFAVQDPRTGDISLTRNGAFYTPAQREQGELTQTYLTDGDGRLVLDQNLQPIPADDVNARMPVGIFDCDNYNGMLHLEGTRFQNLAKNGEIRPGTGKIIQGALEASNVDLTQEIVNMIETQRAYTMALKMMTTSDEIETTINNLRG